MTRVISLLFNDLTLYDDLFVMEVFLMIFKDSMNPFVVFQERLLAPMSLVIFTLWVSPSVTICLCFWLSQLK